MNYGTAQRSGESDPRTESDRKRGRSRKQNPRRPGVRRKSRDEEGVSNSRGRSQNKGPGRVHGVDAHANLGATWLAPATYLRPADFSGLPKTVSITSGAKRAADFAMSLLRADLADASHFDGDVGEFLGRTLEWWGRNLTGEAERRDFSLSVDSSFRSEGEYYTGGEPQSDVHPDGWLVITLRVVSYYGIALGPAVAALESIDRRLPGAVWDTLAAAIGRYFYIWDHRYAINLEEFEEHPLISPDVYFGPDEYDEESRISPKKDTPKSLQGKPATARTLRALVRKHNLDPDSWSGAVALGTLRTAQLAKAGSNGVKRTREIDNDAYANCNGVFPFLIAFMRAGDSLTHLWDYEGDGILESGEPLAPSCSFPFHADSPKEVMEVFGELEHTLRVVRSAHAVLDLLQEPPPAKPQPKRRRAGKPLIETLLAIESEEEAICT